MREGGSGSGGREGMMRKRTSEEGTKAWSDRRKEGRDLASGVRGSNGAREKRKGVAWEEGT